MWAAFAMISRKEVAMDQHNGILFSAFPFFTKKLTLFKTFLFTWLPTVPNLLADASKKSPSLEWIGKACFQIIKKKKNNN